MPEMPFIGRKDELTRIQMLLEEKGTRRFLSIEAPGGMGKTRLLNEVYARFGAQRTATLVCLPVIDLVDSSIFAPVNLLRFIWNGLLERADLGDLEREKRRFRLVGFQDRTGQPDQDLYREFLDFLQGVTNRQRLVLLFDTLDSHEPDWDFLQRLALDMTNMVILAAGRKANELAGAVRVAAKDDVEELPLPPFNPADSNEFMRRKQDQMHFSISPDLAETIILLSESKPIMMDLAFEWVSRSIDLPWLNKIPLDDLRKMPPEELEPVRRKFQVSLVSRIGELASPMDELTLILTHVYPLDAEGVAYLLNIPPDEGQALFEDARTYVFVKTLPDGRITLHDEMREMMKNLAWPEIDPESNRLLRDSRLAAGYLSGRLQRNLDEQASLRALPNSASEDVPFDLYLRSEALKDAAWELKAQILGHLLVFDRDLGVNTFLNDFDEATRIYEFQSRDLMIRQITPYEPALTSQQRYEVLSRKVKFLLDTGEYEKGYALAGQMLADPTLNAEQRIDLHIQNGNLLIRKGNFIEALKAFNTAYDLTAGLPQEQAVGWRARALNARGWGYRNQGNLDAALTDYLEAFEIALDLNDRRRMGWLLNNMGYIYALQGDPQEARAKSMAALKIWEEEQFGRGLAATYSTLGEIARRYNQPLEALRWYDQALDIFTMEEDLEWLSQVRTQRASLYWMQGELDQAESDLRWAVKYAAVPLRPRIYHSLAEVYWKRGQFDRAARELDLSIKASRDCGDRLNEYKSFISTIHLAWQRGEYFTWETFRRDHNLFFSGLSGVLYERLRGSALRNMGDLAVCANAYDQALGLYREGLRLIALREVQRPYLLSDQLEDMETRLRHCAPPGTLNRLGRDLKDYWKTDRDLRSRHSEALERFHAWEQEGAADA